MGYPTGWAPATTREVKEDGPPINDGSLNVISLLGRASIRDFYFSMIIGQYYWSLGQQLVAERSDPLQRGHEIFTLTRHETNQACNEVLIERRLTVGWKPVLNTHWARIDSHIAL